MALTSLISSFLRQVGALSLLAATLAAAAPAKAQTAPTTANVIREITDAVGLKPRFELRATTEIPNAAAVVYGGKRFLLYNPNFVSSVNRAGHTDWAGISILAHEMGHHLNGHTLRAGGSQPADELEADEFSGFVLRKMGASLAQAQAAMATVADDEGSATHPGRTPRLAAISQGWQRAQTQIAASTAQPAPSAAPVVAAVQPVRQPALVASAVQPDNDEEAADQTSATPVRLLGQLTFRNNPNQRYYLTSGLKVVRLDNEDNAEVVGRLTRTSDEAFPYVLTDSQQRRLFITPKGDVYDKQGQRVAKLHDPS